MVCCGWPGRRAPTPKPCVVCVQVPPPPVHSPPPHPREVKQGKSGGSVGTTDQGKGKGRSVVRPMGTVAYRGKGQGKGKGRGEGRLGQGGRGRSKGGEKLMGTTAYGGKGSKGRAANGDRPVGAASCRRDHHTMASCQNPPPPPLCPIWGTTAVGLYCRRGVRWRPDPSARCPQWKAVQTGAQQRPSHTHTHTHRAPSKNKPHVRPLEEALPAQSHRTVS